MNGVLPEDIESDDNSPETGEADGKRDQGTPRAYVRLLIDVNVVGAAGIFGLLLGLQDVAGDYQTVHGNLLLALALKKVRPEPI